MGRQMNSVRLSSGWAVLALVILLCLSSLAFGQVTTTTVTPYGTLTATEGSSPTALSRSGSALTGTTATGGANGMGTVFTWGSPVRRVLVNSSFGIASVGLMALAPNAILLITLMVQFMEPQRAEEPLGKARSFSIAEVKFLTTLHSFSGTDGDTPNSVVECNVTVGGVQKTYLCGTTAAGGANGDGTVFAQDITGGITNGQFTILHSFTGSDGASPSTLLLTVPTPLCTAPPSPEETATREPSSLRI